MARLQAYLARTCSALPFAPHPCPRSDRAAGQWACLSAFSFLALHAALNIQGLALTRRFNASPNSWSTCILGANQEPPRDVAHVQFQARIAFKLVWAPPTFSTFVLVDDAGKLLAKGTPQEGSGLPGLQQRQKNFEVVRGGRYATEAEKVGKA